MRMLLTAQLLAAALPIAASTCQQTDIEPPVITGISFPAVIPGDGSTPEGQVAFTDADAGVISADLENVSCPAGYTCPGQTFDLRQVDPAIPLETVGSFIFTVACVNDSGVDARFVYSFQLGDSGGNLSNVMEFAFTCASVPAAAVASEAHAASPARALPDGIKVSLQAARAD